MESFLNNFGGINVNSLTHTLHIDEQYLNEEYENEVPTICQSPYISDVPMFLSSQENCFSIFSSNIDSLHAKFDVINIFIECLREVNIELSALCFQECHINGNDTSLLEISGYTCITQRKYCGNKGGLVIYLNEKFNYSILPLYKTSQVWEGQFIEISGDDLNKNIILGNVYRPPRNNQDNISKFMDDMKVILEKIGRSKAESLILGDFNFDLLKLNDNSTICDFFELMVSHSFYPKITFPTRFSDNHGTLIDNLFL